MISIKLHLLLPTLLLAVLTQQCTVVLSTPLKAFEQQSLGTEQEENEDQRPQTHMFEGDILITQKQLEDHYGTPTGLDEEPVEDNHVSTSVTSYTAVDSQKSVRGYHM